MRAYSLDLRERVLAAVAAGATHAQAAERFAVGVATVGRWVRRQRTTGSVAPSPRPGRSPRIGPSQVPRLAAQVAAHPDATLAEHCAAWEGATGVRVSPAAMCRTLRKVGLTLKKRPSPPPNATRPRARPGGRRRPPSVPPT